MRRRQLPHHRLGWASVLSPEAAATPLVTTAFRRSHRLDHAASPVGDGGGVIGVIPHCGCVFYKTDNDPRVRDGYISLAPRVTRGHDRQLEVAICRKNVVANTRPRPPVPSQNLHGKEGVNGSSPLEGFTKSPANGCHSVVWFGEAQAQRGYETGTFSNQRTRSGDIGHARSARQDRKVNRRAGAAGRSTRERVRSSPPSLSPS